MHTYAATADPSSPHTIAIGICSSWTAFPAGGHSSRSRSCLTRSNFNLTGCCRCSCDPRRTTGVHVGDFSEHETLQAGGQGELDRRKLVEHMQNGPRRRRQGVFCGPRPCQGMRTARNKHSKRIA